jgi:WD40 repeat protein
VKVWSMLTWACTLSVQACAADSTQYINTLAVSGSTLVSGSISITLSISEEGEVRVWDLATLELLHTFKQAEGQHVFGLASDGGEVWGAIGKEVIVWRRRAPWG